LSQEYPEERSEISNGTQVGERLGRVERLLETLVEKISAYEEEENSQKIMTPESMSNDILTPSMTNISGVSVQDSAPFLSLFDNSVVSIYSQTSLFLLTVTDWTSREQPVADRHACLTGN
jgi:hypothetical protein